MKLIRIKPPLIALGFVLIAGAVHGLLALETPFQNRFLGVIGLAGGLGLMMWAWLTFQKKGTPVCLTAIPWVLVTEGPYRFTRNPMYLGMVLVMFGIAFLVGSLPMFFAPIAFFLTLQFIHIPHEEKTLDEAFGPAYRDYKARVRRWL